MQCSEHRTPYTLVHFKKQLFMTRTMVPPSCLQIPNLRTNKPSTKPSKARVSQHAVPKPGVGEWENIGGGEGNWGYRESQRCSASHLCRWGPGLRGSSLSAFLLEGGRFFIRSGRGGWSGGAVDTERRGEDSWPGGGGTAGRMGSGAAGRVARWACWPGEGRVLAWWRWDAGLVWAGC